MLFNPLTISVPVLPYPTLEGTTSFLRASVKRIRACWIMGVKFVATVEMAVSRIHWETMFKVRDLHLAE